MEKTAYTDTVKQAAFVNACDYLYYGCGRGLIVFLLAIILFPLAVLWDLVKKTK